MSEPIPLLTDSTFAPTFSQRLAISFIKLILVASIEFAAYFVISADGTSIKSMGCPFKVKGLYSLLIISFALSDSAPTTILSGYIKSFMAEPSLRNSGLEATSKSIFTPLFSNSSDTVVLIFCAVPTGTVLLVTSIICLCIFCPTSLATSKTYLRSALPSSSGGVPTAQNITSLSCIESFNVVENVNLFLS